MLIRKKDLSTYFITAQELTEAIKRDIIRDTKVSQKTILALNAFVLAGNKIVDLTTEFEKYNLTIN